MKTKYINYIKEDIEMKKLVMMVMVMVIMSMATGCAHEVEVKETETVETETTEEMKSLDEVISENISEYVFDENVHFDEKEVDVTVDGNDTVVTVLYTFEGHPSGYQMFRINGTEFAVR